jgi:hypothetical protein
MLKYYKEYFWKEGTPIGLDPVDEHFSGERYKIVADPYRKRISIEKYQGFDFVSIIYDSALLNFRDLKKPENAAWQKTPGQVPANFNLKNLAQRVENPEELVCSFIRNQDDRLLFIEFCLFSKNLCRECYIYSPHGLPLSLHKMYYVHLADPFNGVVLYDMNAHSVMMKRYEFDESTQLFTTLIDEDWTIKKIAKI